PHRAHKPAGGRAIEQLDVDGAPGTKLSTRVRLAPVRGYDKAASETAKTLTDLDLTPATDDLVADIAAAIGRQPGDVTSKIVVPFESDEPAAAAYIRGLANF